MLVLSVFSCVVLAASAASIQGRNGERDGSAYNSPYDSRGAYGGGMMWAGYPGGMKVFQMMPSLSEMMPPLSDEMMPPVLRMDVGGSLDDKEEEEDTRKENKPRGGKGGDRSEESSSGGGGNARASFNAWFPIMFGSPYSPESRSNTNPEGGQAPVAAIANSVSHGARGVATSHAVAYAGQPSQQRAQHRTQQRQQPQQ